MKRNEEPERNSVTEREREREGKGNSGTEGKWEGTWLGGFYHKEYHGGGIS